MPQFTDAMATQRRVVERAHVEQWRIAACKYVRSMLRGVETIFQVKALRHNREARHGGEVSLVVLFTRSE